MRNKILRFRAWDGLHKKFSYWSMNDLCTYCEKDEKPSALDKWQQDTGLIDCHGKPIYEGDIVKFMYLNVAEPEERIMPVKLVGLGDDMKVRIITAYSPFCYTTGGSYRDKGRETVDCFLTPPSECEIIGNVHQNPELLTNN